MTQPQYAPQQGFQQSGQQGWAPQGAPAQTVAPAAPQLNPAAWSVGAAQDAGGNGVAMAHLFGRTVAIVPLELLEKQPIKGNTEGKTQDVIRADIFILDGGPFTFGGSPNGKPRPTPDTQIVDQLPWLAENTRIYGAVIVSQLKDKVRSGVSVGRVETMRTGSGNDAWCLTTDATPEQLAMVQQLVMAHYQQRAFQNPVPRMLAPQQPALQAGNPYGQVGGYAPAQPAAFVPHPGFQQAPPMAQPQVGPGPQFGQQPPAPPAFGGFTPAPAPVEDWTLNTMPPGVPAEQLQAWQTQTTPDQRLQMLAAAGITGPQGAPNPGRPTGL